MAVTPNGQRAIFEEEQGVLRVYNLDSMELRAGARQHERVRVLAVTPDGRRAISGGEGTVLYVWNLDTGQVERMLTGHEKPVSAVALTPDGRRAVSSGEDGVHVWNLDRGNSEHVQFYNGAKHDAVAAMAHGWRTVLLYRLIDAEAIGGGFGGLLRLFSGSDTSLPNKRFLLNWLTKWVNIGGQWH